MPLDDPEAFGVSPVEFVAMVANLPEESATMRAVNPDWRWGVAEQLLAAVVDETRVGWWLYERTTNRKSHRKPPEQIQRPGVGSAQAGETVGAGEGFDSIEEFEEWYRSRQSQ